MSRTPSTAGARRTRDRILDAALELFNERGTAAVTTNHVAARAGISPGNLYYWFDDKDEIVQQLYARYVSAHAALWAAGQGSGSPDGATPEELLARLADGAVLSRQYAFLARDLLGLLHADPVLTVEYLRVRADRLAMFTALAHDWRARRLIRPLADGEIADLVQALWIIAETWLAFDELDGASAGADDGARLLRVVLAPYLTPT